MSTIKDTNAYHFPEVDHESIEKSWDQRTSDHDCWRAAASNKEASRDEIYYETAREGSRGITSQLLESSSI